MNEPEAVFHLDGERLVPTALARGPWSPDAQHGGGPAALMARAVEQCDPGPADFVVRMTVELLRPIPLTPLDLKSRTTRPGKKVQWLEVSMSADGTEVARAHALRIRRDDALGFPQIPIESTPMPGVEEAKPITISPPGEREVPEIGFWRAVEMRQARGSWLEDGPAAVWFRLRVPMVAGEEPTPLQRVAAVADFGNGISGTLERGKHLFINPDLTVYLHRAAQGEWIGLDAATAVEPHGIGLALGALHDQAGCIGTSLQSLLIDVFRSARATSA